MNLHYSILKLFYLITEGKKPTQYELEKKLAVKKRSGLQSTTMIGITGSAGKTTASRFLYHLLNQNKQTFLSAILNTSRHIPGQICSIKKNIKYAVFEISGHMPGAINDSCQYVKPDIGIVTIVATDHFSNFRTIANVALEKANLVKNIPKSGLVFLNADDDNVIRMRFETEATVWTYGINQNADYRAINLIADSSGRLQFTCKYKNESVHFDIGLVGLHFITPVMAGISCAHQLGASLLELSERAKSFTQTPGRCSLHHSENGPVFICDTEKSPYQTLPLALDVLKIFKNTPRRTLVIGSVSDKGGTTRKRYDAVTRNDKDYINRIIFFGESASHARPSESQLASGNVFFFTKIQEVRDFIKSTQINNEVILLKGSSKADKLERIAIDYDRNVSCWIDNCKLAENCFSCDLAHK